MFQLFLNGSDGPSMFSIIITWNSAIYSGTIIFPYMSCINVSRMKRCFNCKWKKIMNQYNRCSFLEGEKIQYLPQLNFSILLIRHCNFLYLLHSYWIWNTESLFLFEQRFFLFFFSFFFLILFVDSIYCVTTRNQMWLTSE